MGIIKRQGIKNTITTYIGILIGFISLIVIQPQFLSKEELGLIRILYSFSILVAMFVPIGIGNATTRYFPLFKDKDKNHHGYFAFMMLFPIVGFVLAMGALYILKDFVISRYIRESAMFTEFYYWVFPLTFIIAMISCLNVYCYSNYKSTIPAFLNDVVARIFVIVVVTIYYLKWISLNQFIASYVMLYGVQMLLLLLYIFAFDRPRFNIDWKFMREKNVFSLINYGLLLWFAGVASIGLKYLDSIMIGQYLPIGFVGIYAIAAFIPTVIEAPLTAIEKIAASKIAFAWAENNKKEILDIYRKSSLYMVVLGGLLFTGININITNLLSFLPEPYHQGATVVFIISLGTLFNMATGLNAPILFNSNKYRYGAFFLIGIALVALLLQVIFIPLFGLNGAAIATSSSYLIYNLALVIFVWIHFKIQPFERKMLIILFLIPICFALNYFIPVFENKVLDIVIRSIIITSFYGGSIYFTKLIPEINDLIRIK